MLPATRRPNRQGGVVLVWIALFMLLTLGFVALGIDVAKLLTAHTQLQNAADAAALAGASAVDPETGTIDRDEAISRAQRASSANRAFILDSAPVLLAAEDVEVLGGDRFRVTVRREGWDSVVAHFAGVLGLGKLPLRATATARVDTAASIDAGLVPLGVAVSPGVTLTAGCAGRSLEFGNGRDKDVRVLEFEKCPWGECAGSDPDKGDTYRCEFENGLGCEVYEGRQIRVRSGDMWKRTADAVRVRFQEDSDARENICFSEYAGNGARLLVLPVVRPSGSRVVVTGFVTYFVKSVPPRSGQKVLRGEFAYSIIRGSGGGSGHGAVAFAIRLI